MIKGKVKKEIKKEDILKVISTYDIYRYYQGPFRVNRIAVNKYRGEKTPSLIISSKLKPTLTHKDFGDAYWRGDCFAFVQQVHGCDFKMALSIINRDFNLGLGGVEVIDKQTITWDKPIIEISTPPLLQIVTSKMTKEGWDYWRLYHQGEEDIAREHIYIPKEIWRNKKRLWLGNLLTFCYYYPTLDRWKVYRPHAPARQKDMPPHLWKWDTNLPFDYIENLEAIRDSEVGLLGKSKKDRMVLRKALEIESICNTQAEDAGCLTIEALDIFATCKRKYAVTDNDKKGKEFSWWLTKVHGFKHCNVPDHYLPNLTDFADLSTQGLDKVTNHFKLKHIL